MYVNSYLAHHGILGQRWGKKNGPPYPLGSSAHSQSEKNAGWRKSLDKGSDKSENKREHKGLTDKQKKAIMIAAGVGVAVAGTYAAYKLGAFDKAAVALGKRKIQPFTTQQLHDMGIDTVDVDRINIDRINIFGDIGKTVDSCRDNIQTIAKHAGDSGKDCSAGMISQILSYKTGETFVPNKFYLYTGNTSKKVFDCIKGNVPIKSAIDIDNPDKAFNSITKDILDLSGENNHFGAITFRNSLFGAGHTFSYKVIDGNVVYTDHQLIINGINNTGLHDQQTLTDLINRNIFDDCFIDRLDDCAFDMEKIQKLGCIKKLGGD